MMGLHKGSLTSRLVTLFLIVTLVPIAIVGYMSYSSGKAAIQKQVMDGLTTIVESREMAIVQYLRGKVGRTIDFASDGFVRESVKKIVSGEGESEASVNKEDIVDVLNRHLVKNKISLDKEIYGLNIIDLDGRVIASTKEIEIGLDESKEEYFMETKGLDYGNAYISDVFTSSHFEVKKSSFASSAPLTDKNTGEKLGILVNYFETKFLNEMTTNREGLGNTGEIYIVNENGFMITESRFMSGAVLRQRVDTEPVRLFQSQKKVMTGIYPDYRSIPVVGASMGDEIEEEFGLGWTMLAEVDAEEAFGPIKTLGLWIMLIAIPIAISVGTIAYFMAKGTARPVQDGIKILSSTANELVTTVSQIAAGSAETAAAVSETTTTSEEIKHTALLSSEKAKTVSGNAQKAVAISQDGKKTIEGNIEGMNCIKEQMESIANSIVNLSEQCQAIGEIILTVNDLAEQSNLLAVNASIEASKAGEHGKGFTVVAQEVKNLARQSKEATAQVKIILKDIQKATSNAVMVTEQGSKAVDAGVKLSIQAGDTINILARSIEEASQSVIQIAAASNQQLAGMDQVVEAMDNIKLASNQNVDGTKQLESAAQNLQELGMKLKGLVY